MDTLHVTMKSLLILAATIAIGLGVASAFQEGSTVPLSVGIDADPSGNAATSLGSLEACREVASGETFEVDFYVLDVPPLQDEKGGVMGFSYNLKFNPDVVHVVTIENDWLTQSGGETTVINFLDGDATNEPNNDPFPGTTGNVRVDNIDLSLTIEDGSGVLSRVTLLAVGTGTSDLALSDDQVASDAPLIISHAVPINNTEGAAYAIKSVQNGRIVVGGSCATEPEPTPYVPQVQNPEAPIVDLPDIGGDPQTTEDATGAPETAAVTPTPVGTVAAGDASLAVDTIPTGNAADEVDDVDACAAADEGDTFSIDVVVQDIDDLLAFTVPVGYDEEVLRIVDRDVKLFLEATGGEAFDGSNQTPNETGAYEASGFDSSDPLSPESGSGVLVRLTVEAIAEGTSPLSIQGIDLTDDEIVDRGVLLRNADSLIIGDEDGDSFFDGPREDAEIRVGTDCEDPDARVVLVELESETPTPDNGDDTNGDDDDSNALPFIIGGVLLVLIAGAAAAYFYMRSRRAADGGPPAV